MYNYVLREEDIKQLAELRDKLMQGALVRSAQKNQQLPKDVAASHPDLVPTSVAGHYSQIIIDCSNVRDLTAAEAIAIAQALADTRVDTVWVKGACFRDSSILTMVTNLPANISNLVINNGGLPKAEIAGFPAALAKTNVKEANLNNNMLGDEAAKILCEQISAPLNKLYLAANAISPDMQSTCSKVLMTKGIQLSFGAEVMLAKGIVISRLGNFDGEGYAYARLLAIALLKSDLVIAQNVLTDAQAVYEILLAQGDVDFTHVLAAGLETVLGKLIYLFKLPKPAYSAAKIFEDTFGLAIDPRAVEAARISVLAVLGRGVASDVDTLQAAKAELDKAIADAAEATRKRQELRQLQHRQAADARRPGTTLVQLDAHKAKIIAEAVAARRALLAARGTSGDQMHLFLQAHEQQCITWANLGKSAEIDNVTRADRAKVSAPV